LRGKDPYQPLPYLLFARLLWALLAVVMLITLMAGLIAWSGQQRAKQICRQRNVASAQYRKALEGLAAAAERHGDHESASIYRSITPRAPLPSC
jgi:hypothetical protein